MTAETTTSRTDQIEKLRQRMDRNAHGHIAQALRLQLLDNIATFITTIGGAGIMAAGALLLVTEGDHMIEIAATSLAGCVTLVAVWQAVWRPGERSRRHKEWSSRYSRIEDDCRLLALGEISRSIAQLLNDANESFAQADLVPERFWRRRGGRTQ